MYSCHEWAAIFRALQYHLGLRLAAKGSTCRTCPVDPRRGVRCTIGRLEHNTEGVCKQRYNAVRGAAASTCTQSRDVS